MKVTIIIPNYNGKHFMEPCLASLNEQTLPGFQDPDRGQCLHGRKSGIYGTDLP